MTTEIALQRLRDSGLTNADIIQLVKADGWDAVKTLVE